MKLQATLLALGLAQASELTQQPGEGYPQPPPGEAYPGYFENPQHKLADYSSPYQGVLPSADFNRAVHDFNEDRNVFDQVQYEKRLRVEAELMIALEGLKSSASYLNGEFVNLAQMITSQRNSLADNLQQQSESLDNLAHHFSGLSHRLDGLFEECRYMEQDLDYNKKSLQLYCQQFAFDFDMVPNCKKLLHGRQTRLNYKYLFEGQMSFEQLHEKEFGEPFPMVYADNGHKGPGSTHGIQLVRVGGHVEVDPSINPTLAAAAISPTEAVIQVDGEAVIARFDAIDVSKVELVCNEEGCCLIPKDDNPHNDLVVESTEEQQDHGHDHQDQPHDHAQEHHDHAHPDLTHEHSHEHHDHEESPQVSSHGMELNMVGGNVVVDPSINAELAAAAVSQDEAVIQHNGESFIAPISEIDPDAVELACDDHGCALIPDDGNPYNDIIVESTHDEHAHQDHAHDGLVHDQHIVDQHIHDPVLDHHVVDQHIHDHAPMQQMPQTQLSVDYHQQGPEHPDGFDLSHYHGDGLDLGIDLGPYPMHDHDGGYMEPTGYPMGELDGSHMPPTMAEGGTPLSFGDIPMYAHEG